MLADCVGRQRAAARGVADARTHQTLRAAGADFTAAMQRIGLDQWPRYLADAAGRADAAHDSRAEEPHLIAQLDAPGHRSGTGNAAETVMVGILITHPFQDLDSF